MEDVQKFFKVRLCSSIVLLMPLPLARVDQSGSPSLITIPSFRVFGPSCALADLSQRVVQDLQPVQREAVLG